MRFHSNLKCVEQLGKKPKLVKVTETGLVVDDYPGWFGLPEIGSTQGNRKTR